MTYISRSITLIILIFLLSSNINSQILGNFDSSVIRTRGYLSMAEPYRNVISYYGYYDGEEYNNIYKGKKINYVYVWIQKGLEEIGAKIVSPALDAKGKKKIKSHNYVENRFSKESFNTYITIEKSDIDSIHQLNSDFLDEAIWQILDENDDSNAVIASPSSNKKTNSLVRYKFADRSLSGGLYRIGITDYKKGYAKGTYVLQVGILEEDSEMFVANTISGIYNLIKIAHKE